MTHLFGDLRFSEFAHHFHRMSVFVFACLFFQIKFRNLKFQFRVSTCIDHLPIWSLSLEVAMTAIQTPNQTLISVTSPSILSPRNNKANPAPCRRPRVGFRDAERMGGPITYEARGR